MCIRDRDSWLYNEMLAAGIQCVSWWQASSTESIGGQGQGACAPSGEGQNAVSPVLWAWCRKGVRTRLPKWVKLLSGNIRECVHLIRVFRGHPVDVMHVNVHGYEVAGLACRRVGLPCVGLYHISPSEEEGGWLRHLLIRHTGRAYDLSVGVSRYCIERWRKVCGRAVEQCLSLIHI